MAKTSNNRSLASVRPTHDIIVKSTRTSCPHQNRDEPLALVDT